MAGTGFDWRHGWDCWKTAGGLTEVVAGTADHALSHYLTCVGAFVDVFSAVRGGRLSQNQRSWMREQEDDLILFWMSDVWILNYCWIGAFYLICNLGMGKTYGAWNLRGLLISMDWPWPFGEGGRFRCVQF